MSRRREQAEPTDHDRDLGLPADPESVARAIVLRKLTGQARSRHELEVALAAKDVPSEVAARVLDRFEEVGLVNDASYADAWVQSRRSTRGLARRALTQELRRKGVSDDIVRDTVDAISPDDERTAAYALVERKLAVTRTLEPHKRFRRLVGLLARKGYSSSLAMAVVREAIAEEERAGARSDA